MTTVAYGQAANETVLIAAIAAAATTAGWTVYGPSSTTPANTTWFVSNGSLGVHRIVGGLQPAGTRQISIYNAVDIDANALISASVGGYTNNDSANTTAVSAKVQMPSTAGFWTSRGVAATYSYMIVADLDDITVQVSYDSTVPRLAQGLIVIGIPRPQGGQLMHEYAVATITVIDASMPSTTIVTLDRNINAALKDTSDPYRQGLLFQSVYVGGMSVADFALTQRIKFLSGSLTLSGGLTQFQIDASASGKLTGTPGGTTARYKAGRGVGDRVRLMTQPTLTFCASVDSGGIPSGSSSHSMSMCDAVGGQGAAILTAYGNANASVIASVQPGVERNRYVAWPIYATVRTNATTMIPQSDSDGKKTVGILRHVLRHSSVSVPVFGLMRLDYNGMLRYRSLGSSATEGMRAMASIGSAANSTHFIGPGW